MAPHPQPRSSTPARPAPRSRRREVGRGRIDGVAVPVVDTRRATRGRPAVREVPRLRPVAARLVPLAYARHMRRLGGADMRLPDPDPVPGVRAHLPLRPPAPPLAPPGPRPQPSSPPRLSLHTAEFV